MKATLKPTGSSKSKLTSKSSIAKLESAAAIFENEFVADQSRPLSPKNQARWSQIKKKMGRPKVGKGVKVVSISLEQGLLKKADRLAKKLGLSRAGLVSRGLARLVDEGK